MFKALFRELHSQGLIERDSIKERYDTHQYSEMLLYRNKKERKKERKFLFFIFEHVEALA